MGKFVVVYGANNVGKTTQMGVLEGRVSGLGIEYERIKYPIYGLKPTGPRLNGILRQRTEEVSPFMLQTIFAENRRDFEGALFNMLLWGKTVLAEDYKGTGIAWGLVFGVPLDDLERLNRDLREPDLSILLDGPRRLDGAEKGHLHEERGDLWEKVRGIHLMLAERYGWVVVNGFGGMEEVSERIWSVVRGKIGV